MSDGAAPRHAVYFAPDPAHPLWAAGCAWLGRDARSGPSATPAPPARAHVASPWRYGWHATLKAPMRLAPGADQSSWLAAVAALAARHAAFDMPALVVAPLSDFLALRPVQALPGSDALRRLADDCVVQLDPWRAAPGEAERARWRQAGLDARRSAQALRWGYPHVFDDWRFHMTLSDRLAGVGAAQVEALRRAAEQHFAAALALPLRCNALCVFVEPVPGAPFELRHRFALAAA